MKTNALTREDIQAVVNSVLSDDDASARRLSSMEVIWSIAELEHRFGIKLRLGEQQLGSILMSSDAVGSLYDVVRTVTA